MSLPAQAAEPRATHRDTSNRTDTRMTDLTPPPSHRRAPSRRFQPIAALLLCAALLATPGCAILGVFAAKVAPPPTIPPQYSGFAHQSVGIMIWADTGVEIDFPGLRLD